MKKRLFAMMMVMLLGVSVVACSKSGNSEEAKKTDTKEEAGTTEVDESEVLLDYENDLDQLVGNTFKLYGINDANEGIKAKLEGGSGRLATVYLNYDVVVEGDCEANKLTLYSLKVNDEGSVEKVGNVEINDFFEFADEYNITIASATLGNGNDAIVIECNSSGYTFADGTAYHLYVIEQKEDGSLELAYDEGLAGSGDEDITADIRKSFNEYSGLDISKDEFEDAFYNSNLLTLQKGWKVCSRVIFKSETAKMADEEDWDGIEEITSQLYSGNSEDIYWGEGAFEEAQ